MRVVGGEAKGRTILCPGGRRLRPTADRVKESLFSLLGPLTGSTFLDLFAGSGNVGLEALSRGGRSALFVERDRDLAKVIRENLRLLGFAERGEVLTLEAKAGLKRLVAQGARFDILFADPPYEQGHLASLAPWWTGTELLSERGLWVLQHSVHEPWPALPPDAALQMTDQRRYGDTLLTFLTKRDVR
jgi:16S rRNA (guanine(966)-N(2))-methyltransferase RsmD